jgi:cystathionine gamma-synthase
MATAGGMLSFDPAPKSGRSGAERARAFCEATGIFRLAESLGGVESLCEVPAVMTHGSVAGSALEISPALVRLSVGVEHPADLVEDVVQALDRA